MAIFLDSQISGSATSTGSFGSVVIDTNISQSSPLTIDGTSGRLLTVTDEMSGSVFSANLISGLPVIEAFSDNKVNIGPFSKPVKIGGDGSLTVSSSIMAKGTYNSNATYIQINPFGSNPFIASSTNTNAMKLMNLSGIMFERRNPDSNQFYRYHAYFEYSSGRSYFGGSTMIHSNGALLDGGDPKALLHVSGGNFYVEGGNISGSATSTGSFGMVMITDSVGSPHKWFGDTYYLRTNSNLRIPGYIYSDGVINLDAGANDIRLGSSSGGANTVHFKTDGSTDGISIVQNHLSGSLVSTASFAMITTPSDIGGKPAARLHKFAFLRASDRGDASTSGFSSLSGNTIFGYDAASQIVQNNGAGHSNTYIGHYAGHGNASGDNNTAIGHVAGLGGSGDNNTSVGSYAGYNITSGGNLVLIGKSAGVSITEMSDTVVIGYNAGDALTTGVGRNVAIGSGAMSAMTTQTQNIAIGSSALGTATNASNVIAIGHRAAVALSHGDSSGTIAIGALALEGANGSHTPNIAIGYRAINSATTNVAAAIALGYETMYSNADNTGNIAIGYFALRDGVGGSSRDYNIAIGYDAMRYANPHQSIAIGYNAGLRLKDGAVGAVHIGIEAGKFASGSGNTFMGYTAGYGGTTSAPYSTGEYNVAVGYAAFDAFTTAQQSVAVGRNALGAVTTANGNTGLGYASLASNQTGDYNTAIGWSAMSAYTSGEAVAVGFKASEANTTGGGNTSVGAHAHRYNQTGTSNTAMGYQALYGASGNSHSQNVAIGYQSSRNITTGGNNVTLGYQSGYNLTTGELNVFVGTNAGANSTVSQRAVGIGYEALNRYGLTSIGTGAPVAIGFEAGRFATGSANVFVGYEAGKGGTQSGNLTSGNNNVGIGYTALKNFTTAERVTAVGHEAGAQVTTSRFGVFLGYRAGYAVTTADFGPIAIGHLALGAMTDKAGNTAIGYEAAYANDTATNATFIGWTAGRLSTGGVSSTIVGSQAGMYIVGSDIVHIGTQAGYYATGSYNTFVGSAAGKGSATSAPYSKGTNNTAMGYGALKNFTTGYSNVAIGSGAADALTDGGNNIAIGQSALGAANSGEFENVAIGVNAMGNVDNSGADNNVAIGYNAGLGGSGQFSANVAIGAYALDSTGTAGVAGVVAIGGNALTAANNTNVDYSVAVGHSALGELQSGQMNVAVGYQALAACNAGQFNVTMGAEAGKFNVTGTGNIYMGYQAGRGLFGNSHSYNVGLGYQSLYSVTTGGNNVAIGYHAGHDITTGHENTIVGHQAGENVTTADNNVIMGFQAGQNLTSARYNVLIGDGAGKNLTTQNGNNENVFIGNLSGEMADEDGDGVNQSATDNVYIGSNSGRYLDDGAYNVIIGKEAGKSSSGTQRNAIRNVILGMEAAQDITTADDNVMAGYQAGANITSGPRNTLLGKGAGDTITTGENNILIGHGADVDSTAGSNRIGIGYNVNVNADNNTWIGVNDTDITTVLGRVALHSVSSDYATFSHYDQRTSGIGYALRQESGGATMVNAPSGQKVNLAINNSQKLTVNGDAVGIGTTSPGQKLDIQGSSSNGTFIQIRDTGDDYPVGVTYNHGVSGHHYAWYAGTMDGTSGERKFTIGVKVSNGFHNDLTTSDYSLLTLNQMDSSVSVINDLDVGGTYTNNTQPAFLAYNSSVDSNRAVDTDHTVEFNTEVYDQANNFDNSTDTFTAPTTGKYLLSVQVRLDDIDKDANWVNTKIVTSNREYRRFIDPVGFDTNVDHFGMHMTVVADMDANDTAHVIVRQSGGSAILDIEPGNPTSQIDTFFSGYLLG